ncbi:unnamed protein product [Clonostachys rosea f. rosea IK726]|uniref:Uncharacterized protein n=1 Tax=Clonostachys rosea f. rosea IK726 TaxID=1349383 RepID=A0ACA9UJN6_BIOOC|nr:unnamed protein product [Clonostachys rosea f. rosea IK726]
MPKKRTRPANAAHTFAFVSVNDFGQVQQAADRRLIRSHCMIGKNKRRTDPKSKLCKHSWGGENEKESQEPTHVQSPIAPPSDLLLVKFVNDIDSQTRKLLFEYFVESNSLLYPQELGVDHEYSRSSWFVWLSYDLGFFQSVLLSASAMVDYKTRKPFSNATHQHLQKTIGLLNERLSDDILARSDATISIVLNLTRLADYSGDEEAKRTHISGLQRLVHLRGGLDAFRSNNKMWIKLSRLDFGFCLDARQHFETEPAFWDPLFDSKKPLPSENPIYGLIPELSGAKFVVDSRLDTVFRDLQYFSALLNTAVVRKQTISDKQFHEIVCSIQRRLMRLQDTLPDLLGECFRLGMLAFLATLFQVPRTPCSYPYLETRLKEAYQSIETTPDRRDLLLWLLMVGAMTVHKPEDRWLRDRWLSDVSPSTWPEVRGRLQDIVWINALHDRPGREVFDVLSMKKPDFFD